MCNYYSAAYPDANSCGALGVSPCFASYEISVTYAGSIVPVVVSNADLQSQVSCGGR